MTPDNLSVTDESEKDLALKLKKPDLDKVLKPRITAPPLGLSARARLPRTISVSNKLSQGVVGSDNPPTAAVNSRESSIHTASMIGILPRATANKTMNEPIENYNDKIRRSI